MISAWWLLPAFGLGLIIGIAMIALLNSAKEADDRMEKFMNNLDTPSKERRTNDRTIQSSKKGGCPDSRD